MVDDHGSVGDDMDQRDEEDLGRTDANHENEPRTSPATCPTSVEDQGMVGPLILGEDGPTCAVLVVDDAAIASERV